MSTILSVPWHLSDPLFANYSYATGPKEFLHYRYRPAFFSNLVAFSPFIG